MIIHRSLRILRGKEKMVIFKRFVYVGGEKMKKTLGSAVMGLFLLGVFGCQQANIAPLEEKVNALEGKVVTLTSRLDSMEARIKALDSKIADLEASMAKNKKGKTKKKVRTFKKKGGK